MPVVLLRERHGKRASGVTYRLAPADPLRFMDMPQRRISDTGVEGICGYGLQPSHDRTLAPIVVRQLGSGSVEVYQGYDRLAGVPPGVGIGVEPPVHPPDARHIRVGLSLRCRRVIPLAEERHRQAKRLLFSRPVPQRDDERSEVDLPGIRPPHDTYDRGIQFLQQGIRGFQTDRGVVVAGDDHDLQARVQAVRLPQETIETALRPRREGEAEERALSYNDLQKIAPLDMLRHTFAVRYGGELPEEIETLFDEVMREVSL